jgi:hypothetical protein|tara:strand:- start:359 stop:550 length:192 start_codon:yes stop_codon:yes gene_type:complete
MKKVKTIVLLLLVGTSSYLIGNDTGQQQKVVEIQNKLTEVDMEWYNWQDVENIVNSKTINGYQ